MLTAGTLSEVAAVLGLPPLQLLRLIGKISTSLSAAEQHAALGRGQVTPGNLLVCMEA